MKSFRTSVIPTVAMLCFAAFTPAEPAPTPSGEYAVSNTLKISGEGRWDYVVIDPKTQTLYVPRQTHTQIIKAYSGEVIADLPGTAGVHGVALVPELNRGFTSDGNSNSATVFDLTTNKKIGEIPAGQKPDAIIYDPASKKVLVFNGKSNDVTVIDPASEPASGKIQSIALDGAPEFAVSDGQGHVYVNLEDKDSVAVIDTKEMKVIGVWKIEGGEGPSGLAIDIAHHRIFSGCHNQVMAVLDTETGKTITTISIGNGVDACAFDAGTGEAFASCGDGTLTVARETTIGKFEVVQTVKTRAGARTMALDPVSHTIYLPTAELQDPASGTGRPAPKPGTFMILVVTRAGK